MGMSLVVTVLSLIAFLGGLSIMRDGLEGMAHGRLPLLIRRFVRTPTRGILTGVTVTALVQSSAAVTALCVGMVAGGSMPFRHALGVVLGANVGSTVTPQLLTLNLWTIVVPALVLGIALLISRRPRLHHPGMALLGFAAIFIALQTLSAALEPFARTPWFSHTLRWAAQDAWLAALAGCLGSAALQSSTATTILTMALCEQGLIPVTSGIAVVLGANVGTCLTSVIAALGQPRAAMQVALSHVVLNLGGVLAFLPWLDTFRAWVAYFGSDPGQQIANAHSLFNIACTLVVWPWTHRFAALIERLVPNERGA